MAHDPTDPEELGARLRWLRMFLQKLTHEIAAPLTPLAGHLELIISRQDDLSSDLLRRCLDAAQRASERLVRFNAGIIEIARLERGSPAVENDEVDPAALMAKVFKKWNVEASKNKVCLLLEPIDQALSSVVTDSRLLVKALDQILDNSVRFSPEGGKIFIRVRAGSDPDLFEIEVEDQGCSIPQGTEEEVVQPFVKLSEDRADQKRPGLGLSIAWLAARALNGRLVVTPHSTGLSVILELPRFGRPDA